MPLNLAFVLILVDEYWLSDQWSIQNSNNNLHLCSLLVKTLAYFAIEQGIMGYFDDIAVPNDVLARLQTRLGLTG